MLMSLFLIKHEYSINASYQFTVVYSINDSNTFFPEVVLQKIARHLFKIFIKEKHEFFIL